MSRRLRRRDHSSIVTGVTKLNADRKPRSTNEVFRGRLADWWSTTGWSDPLSSSTLKEFARGVVPCQSRRAHPRRSFAEGSTRASHREDVADAAAGNTSELGERPVPREWRYVQASLLLYCRSGCANESSPESLESRASDLASQCPPPGIIIYAPRVPMAFSSPPIVELGLPLM